jgi:hypothetical protein
LALFLCFRLVELLEIHVPVQKKARQAEYIDSNRHPSEQKTCISHAADLHFGATDGEKSYWTLKNFVIISIFFWH